MADGLVKKHTRNGGIHAAGEAQDHLIISNLRPEIRYRGLDERSGGPVSLAATDTQRKVGKHLRTFRGVVHFRMELHGEGGFPGKLEGRIFHIGRGGNHLCTFRQGRYGIPVGHPHLRMGAYALEQGRIGLYHVQHGTAVFPRIGILHLSSPGMGQILGAVADAQ